MGIYRTSSHFQGFRERPIAMWEPCSLLKLILFCLFCVNKVLFPLLTVWVMSFLATSTPGNHAGTTAPGGRHCYAICYPLCSGTSPWRWWQVSQDTFVIILLLLHWCKSNCGFGETTHTINNALAQEMLKYSVVLIQEVLQRWKPWRWAVYCPVIRRWQRPIKSHHWSWGGGDDRGWDGWVASLTRWTWVWASSRNWWWTGKPGVLQSMGSQRVRHDWVTELNRLRLMLLTTAWEITKQLNVDHSTVIQHLKQIGKVKKLSKWVPHELTENFKNHHFEGSSSLTVCSNELFLYYIVMCNKSGFYMTTSDDQLSSWTEKKLHSTFQNQTCTKKRSWSLFGCLLPIWSTIAFWILAKPLHLRSVLSKSMRCTENFNTCSWHWSTERAQFSMTMLGHTSHNQHFKSWMNWAM